eukprot:SAG31_NODE_4046_length_3639_cov_19.403390_3_plen_99_part_00
MVCGQETIIAITRETETIPEKFKLLMPMVEVSEQQVIEAVAAFLRDGSKYARTASTSFKGQVHTRAIQKTVAAVRLTLLAPLLCSMAHHGRGADQAAK